MRPAVSLHCSFSVLLWFAPLLRLRASREVAHKVIHVGLVVLVFVENPGQLVDAHDLQISIWARRPVDRRVLAGASLREEDRRRAAPATALLHDRCSGALNVDHLLTVAGSLTKALQVHARVSARHIRQLRLSSAALRASAI